MKTRAAFTSNQPIGLFDSGVGGLTVMKAVAKLLPNERLIYYGDTARFPYGAKSKATIIRYSKEISSFLLQKRVKLIVVACNTASARALSVLRKELPVPVIGVITPAARMAVKNSKNGNVGVIGTYGTISSNTYADTIRRLDRSIRVYQEACPLFVPLVEEGWLTNKITHEVVKEYIAPLTKRKIDTLILGCTHYPLLRAAIGKALPGAALIESGYATALEVREALAKRGLLRENASARRYEIYASDVTPTLRSLSRRIFKDALSEIKLKAMD